ncbi:hypothetical protein EN793_34235, partial [Mesorhizobium sp. M4B.F.Ca.ET.150.01.1.1]
MRRLSKLLCFVAGMLTAGVAHAGQAEQAYKRGDYATAFGLWNLRAKTGDAEAEDNLGTAYAKG